MTPTPAAVRDALEAAGLEPIAAPGWDNPAYAAPGPWAPAYVIMHHTGNGGAAGDAPSLSSLLRTAYAPVRGAHLLIARSGAVHLVYGGAAYHAGAGGPGRWGDGPPVPADTMNRYAYGIEIESAGLSLDTTARNGTDGITPAQYVAAATAAAALLDLMGRATGCALNHRTWAPGRKIDTHYTDAEWARLIDNVRQGDGMAPIDYDALARAVWDSRMLDPVTGTDETARTMLQRVRVNAKQTATRPTAPGDPAGDAAAIVDEIARRLGA